MVILHYTEECGHGLQVVVGGIAREQLHDEAAHAPDIRGGSDLGHLNHLGEGNRESGGRGRGGRGKGGGGKGERGREAVSP